MNPEHKKYILENAGKKTIKELAKNLGLKERKIKKFLDKNKYNLSKARTGPAIITARQTAFASMRIPSFFIIFLILVIGFIAYGSSLNNEFVFDDIQQVVNNTAIRSFGNIPSSFTHSLGYYGGELESKFYRPIQTLTYIIDYFFSDLNPLGYHLTNTLLHTMVCILLFYIISFITANRLLSSLAVLVYMVHPVHTEAVTYVSGRADSLCTVFLLIMIIFQFKYWNSGTKSGRLTAYSVIMISFLFALLSKESAMVFPVLLMFTEYCLRGKERYEKLTGKRFIFYVPFITLAVMWFLIKNIIVPSEAMVEDPNALKLTTTLKIIPKLIFDYIRISFLPFNLHMEYKLPFPESIFQQGYFGPLIFMLCFLPFIYYIWKKGKGDLNYRILFFGLGWFIAALLPYLSIFFPLNAAFSEHWLYIPEMGLALFTAYFLLYHTEKIKILGKLSVFFCLVLITAFSYLTIKQNMVWKDKITFYTYTIKHAPYSPKAYNNLAVEYIKKKELIKAKELLEKAVEVDPNYKTAAENLNYLKIELGM